MHDLGALLNEQVGALQLLEEVIRRQRKFLRGRDVPGIIETVSDQGRCLEKVHRLDRERARIVRSLSADLGLPGDSTLTTVANRMDGAAGEEIRALGVAMRSTLENIERVNRDNRRVLQQSLKLVQEMMSAAVGSKSTATTYGDSGAIEPQRQSRTLVDRTT